jgi:hypothetical protein
MSLFVDIQEFVAGPIKDLYLELTSGPLVSLPSLPPVDIQVGPETTGDIVLGSSFGDIPVGSTAGDVILGSTGGDVAPTFGSSNGDQNLGSSGLSLPSIPGL